MKRLFATVLIIFSIYLSFTQAAYADIIQGTVDTSVRYQVLEGFGASNVWSSVTLPDLGEAHPEIYDIIFGDLGLDILRLRNTYDYDPGYIERCAAVIYEGRERTGRPLKILISSWSPPDYLKSNSSTLGGGNATLSGGPGSYVYEDFANWWADSLEEYAYQDIVADYINIQNEPDFETSDWDSCRFEPTKTSTFSGYDQAFEAVYKEVYDRMGDSMPKMLVSDCTGHSRAGEYIDNIDNSSHVYGYSHHLYNCDNGGNSGCADEPDLYIGMMSDFAVNYGDKPIIQTEYSDDSHVTTHQACIDLAVLMHNSLTVENVSGYLYWELTWGTTRGLVSISYTDWTINPVYYAMKHFSALTDPDWQRVDASTNSSNLRISSFVNPDNEQLTTVIINNSNTNETLDLNSSNFEYVFSKVYQSSDSRYWVLLGQFLNPVPLPAKSITTIAFYNYFPDYTLTCSSTEGGFISNPGEDELTFSATSTVYPTAEAYDSYHFVRWAGTAVDAGKVEDPYSPSTSLYIDDNYTLIAIFARSPFPISPSTIVDWGITKTNTALTELIAVASGGGHNLGLKMDGSVVAWGDNYFGQSEIPSGNDFIAVAAGENHSLALKTDGSIVAWGLNESHQCDVPPPNSEFIAIAAGSNHSLGLKADGSLVGWGSNSFGQRTPPAGNDFVAIAAGYWHSLALKADGSIVAWGDNSLGQATIPESFAPLSFSAIAAGNFHSLALTSTGAVVAWGLNDYGQTDSPDGNNFTAVAAGADHSLAKTADGNVVAWGCNDDSQASPSADLTGVLAIDGGLSHTIALKSDGTVVGWGNNDYGQSRPPSGNDFIAASVGVLGHTLALRQDGSIVGWGNNTWGQADPPPGNDFIAVAAGAEHSLALKLDGTILAWGNNDFEQTDIDNDFTFTAIAAGDYHSLALSEEGYAFAWGDDTYGQADQPYDNDVTAIAAGAYHCLALKADASIIAWGNDWYGQAQPPQGNDFVAIAAGAYHSLALRADGSIVGWGSNVFGETDVPAEGEFIAIAAGDYFSVAMKSDGSIVAWGDNFYGESEPPDGNSFVAITAGGSHALALLPVCQPPPAPTGLSATDGNFVDHIYLDWQPLSETGVYEIWRSDDSNFIAASKIGECSAPPYDDFTNNGTTYYYRVRLRNDCATGLFSSQDSGFVCVPPPPSVSVSKGLYTDRIRITWNAVPRADYYELWRGVADGTEPIFKIGAFNATIYEDLAVENPPTGYNSVEPGLTYYYWVRALNGCGYSPFSSLESGYVDNSSQSSSISGGELFAWGFDRYGQTNFPAGNDFIAVSAGLNHSLALKRDGSIVGFGSNTDASYTNPRFYGQAIPPAGNNFITISAGGFHSLALKRDGSIAGWGANYYGQAAPPAGNDYVAISAGYMHSLALKADGSIVAWGGNYYGQSNPPAGNDFVAVSAGYYHSLALKSDGTIICWGTNYYGLTVAPAGKFTAISASIYYNVALRDDGSLVTWGQDASTIMAPPAGNDFVSIAAGSQQCIALDRDGYIAAWGYDSAGFYKAPACNGFIAVSAGNTHYLAIATKPVDLNEPPVEASITIQVVKATVKAGKDRPLPPNAFTGQVKDAISISGLMDATAEDFELSDSIEITVDSNDMPNPLICLFPVDGSTFKKGKFKATLTDGASKSSLSYNLKTMKFSFSAKSVNLTGLSCPVTLTVKIGSSWGLVDLDEPVINGPKKPVPINLLMGIEDSLRVDAIKVKKGKKPDSDQLTVKGAFALAADINMAAIDFSVKIVKNSETQTFTIPAGSFKPGKGKYSCSKVDLYDGLDLIGNASANFVLNKCTFTMTIKKTKILANPGDTAQFIIEFPDFSECTEVLLH